MLMTEFDNAEKIGCFDFLFRIVWFWQFQTQTEEGAKIKDLEIQGEFKHEKGGKALKDQDTRNSSQKDEVAKTGWSGF
jgi:hypothetical protein